MTPPTIKELCEKATPGPWSIGAYLASTIFANVPGVPGGPVMIAETTNSNEAANAQLIARLSPSVVKVVVEALEEGIIQFEAYSRFMDGRGRAMHKMESALNALNGKSP